MNKELMKQNQILPEEMLAHFQLFSRFPFQNELVKLLESAPTIESLQKLADKSPDRYYQAITMIARLAGYTEKVEIQADVRHLLALKDMSDYDIDNKIKELGERLQNLNKEQDNTIIVEK